MAYIPDVNFTTTGTLASAVANTGTFTVNYPSPTAQRYFTSGLAGTKGSIIINNNDVYTVAAATVSFTYGASNITVTNSSGVTWPAGATFSVNLDTVDAPGAMLITVPNIRLAAISANQDWITLRPGVDGVIEYAEFMVSTPATTASRAATLNLKINSTLVTGASVALTSANATPAFTTVVGTAATANNVITKYDSLVVNASGVTAFAEGDGALFIRIRPNVL